MGSKLRLEGHCDEQVSAGTVDGQGRRAIARPGVVDVLLCERSVIAGDGIFHYCIVIVIGRRRGICHWLSQRYSGGSRRSVREDSLMALRVPDRWSTR